MNPVYVTFRPTPQKPKRPRKKNRKLKAFLKKVKAWFNRDLGESGL